MLRLGTVTGLLIFSATVLTAGQAKGHVDLPNSPGKETVQKVCTACHGAEVIVPRGMTRQEWGEVVASMVAKGAKGTDEEFATVLDYLSTNFPPGKAAPTGGTSGAQVTQASRPAARGPGFLAAAGSQDKHIVDEAGAKRGGVIYQSQCASCHGPQARGTETGPDLVRSVMVLHDRYGSTIGPFLAKGHPANSSPLTQAQVADLSHFLHQSVADTLRSGPYSKVINVLTGNAQEGETYFNGVGKCNTCHSPTGDLAHIASKYDPATLQQRVVFPQTLGFGGRGGVAKTKPATVKVTTPSGTTMTGLLLSLDDFSVALRDSDGDYHEFQRTPDLKVEKKDPYAGHIALLDQYTDKEIHDVVAYLETLK